MLRGAKGGDTMAQPSGGARRLLFFVALEDRGARPRPLVGDPEPDFNAESGRFLVSYADAEFLPEPSWDANQSPPPVPPEVGPLWALFWLTKS